MLSNAFAAGSNGPGTTTSTHAGAKKVRFGADTRPIADGITSSRHHRDERGSVTTMDQRQAARTGSGHGAALAPSTASRHHLDPNAHGW
jgi:hypothetical protein